MEDKNFSNPFTLLNNTFFLPLFSMRNRQYIFLGKWEIKQKAKSHTTVRCVTINCAKSTVFRRCHTIYILLMTWRYVWNTFAVLSQRMPHPYNQITYCFFSFWQHLEREKRRIIAENESRVKKVVEPFQQNTCSLKQNSFENSINHELQCHVLRF